MSAQHSTRVRRTLRDKVRQLMETALKRAKSPIPVDGAID